MQSRTSFHRNQSTWRSISNPTCCNSIGNLKNHAKNAPTHQTFVLIPTKQTTQQNVLWYFIRAEPRMVLHKHQNNTLLQQFHHFSPHQEPSGNGSPRMPAQIRVSKELLRSHRQKMSDEQNVHEVSEETRIDIFFHKYQQVDPLNVTSKRVAIQN